MKKQPYTWIKRASWWEKALMLECVEVANEMAYEELECHPFQYRYTLERTSDSWVMACYIDKVYPGFEDMYTIGDKGENVGFVRCSKCKDGVRTLASGQIEFCLHCETSW